MSSSKRRKLDLTDAPPSPVSAISAIAARRRLTEVGDASSASSPSTPEPKQGGGRISSPNAFSVLQNLSRQGDSASTVAAKERSALESKAATSRASGPKRNDSQRNTPSFSRASSSSDTRPSSSTVQFTSFRPTKHNHRTTSKGVTQLSLSEGERFLVLGSFGIRLLEGEVTVAGATLRPSHDIQWIHAPHCHAIPVLRTVSTTKIELYTDPKSYELRQLGKLSPLLSSIWTESDEGIHNGLKQTFRILYSSEDAPDKSLIQELVSPPAWNRKLSELVTSAANNTTYRVLVCGPKSAGKSTFGRLLTNRLVTRQLKDTSGVACLDLDPGQPEYGLPGTLSLVHVIKPNLGPSFTRTIYNDWTKSIIRCHAIASVSPASDPDLYRSCVVDLYKTYCSELSDKPLVINTPGWILGTGLELLGEIIQLTDTNEVVYMSEEGPAETVDALRASTGNTFSTLPSQPSEASSRTAAQFRSMHTMCYFHQHSAELASSSGRPIWKTSPLTAVAPLQVRFSGPDSGIDGILTYQSQSPSELLAETICGMVLAAVEIEDLRAYGQLLGDHSPKPTILRTPEGLPYISNPHDITLDPTFCRSIGLVLVRGIDAKTQTLQILTPISLTHIDNIKQAGHSIVLVHGKFDVPGWAYTEDLYNRSDVKDDSPEQVFEAGDEESLGVDSASLAQAPHMVGQETSFPWVEVLKGNQRRPTGSRVWRVRRDLGRKGGDG